MDRVGREPSGSAFNSIVQLETESGIPRNPFINAGAIAVADMILGAHEPIEAIGEILRFVRSLADDDSIFIDERIARAEQETGFRNIALANYMRAFGNRPTAGRTDARGGFHQCALAMSCCQLAPRWRLSDGRRHQPGDRSFDRLAPARTPHQRADDDLRPL